MGSALARIRRGRSASELGDAGEEELDPESMEAKLRAAASRRLSELGWEPELPAEEEAAAEPEN